jgi:hypothetical protein
MKLPGVTSLRNDLPICATPKRKFAPAGVQHVEKVYEDALRGFGTQINQRDFGSSSASRPRVCETSG